MTCIKHSKQSLASFFHSYFSIGSNLLRSDPIKQSLVISPSFSSDIEIGIPLQPFIDYVSQTLFKLIPNDILKELKEASSSLEFERVLSSLSDALPIIKSSDILPSSTTFSTTLLVPANYTHGVGRYFTDTVSRWLIPGKFLPIFSSQSLNFHFNRAKKHLFFINQIIAPIEDPHEVILIQQNFPSLAEEIRLNINAVKHSRRSLAGNRLSPEQKRALIEEGISSLLNRPQIETDSNVFDQMHHFLLKLSGEEKESEIKKSFSLMLKHRPFLFDRDIFSEIRYFILLFRDHFTAMRSHRHITKTISILYFFRKALLRKLSLAPTTRHLSFKIFKAQLTYPHENKNVLSILIGINILQENEFLEKRHILSAVENTLQEIDDVKNSFVVDRRPSEKIRLYYLEIEKKDGSSFSLKEMIALKKRLPRELKKGIENVLHPILLSRNEEEIMRNIVMLSHELKYVHDIPQAYISFDAQMGRKLSFIVILLRILHPKHKPIQETLNLAQTPLCFFDFETKRVGFLRKKHIKEANVFRVELDKTPFLRKDFSLDLFKARLVVSEELAHILGEIRDFNGGILSKQHEALCSLKNSLKDVENSNEFLIENFFYSLTPPISRTILYTSLISSLYLLMLEILKKDFTNERFSIERKTDREYTLTMIASPYGPFKAKILNALSTFNIPTLDLSITYNDSNEIACLGIIHRSENEETSDRLFQTLVDAMEETIPEIRSIISL